MCCVRFHEAWGTKYDSKPDAYNGESYPIPLGIIKNVSVVVADSYFRFDVAKCAFRAIPSYLAGWVLDDHQALMKRYIL